MKIGREHKGFTLIELVIVIVILGILAAVAIPRYIRVVSEARKAAVNGMAGGLRSATMLAKAKYMVVGDDTLATVDMDGTAVAVMAGSGVPLGTQAGIVSAITDTAGFDVVVAAPLVTFRPTNGGSATCGVVYSGPTTSVTPAVVTVTVTDCGV
jgi:MSHA pilin protein MshA